MVGSNEHAVEYVKDCTILHTVLNCILSHVYLSVNVISGKYQMAKEDNDRLNDQVKTLCQPKAKQPATITSTGSRANSMEDNGRRTIVVEPNLTECGSRRSSRKRKMIISEIV